MAPTVVNLPSTHSSSRGGHAIAAIVIHATAGTDSRSWLVKNPQGVSTHALVARDGTIYRMAPEHVAAHHCGYSRLVVAGRTIDRSTAPTPNQITLGIELENLNNGRQEYPPAQLSAMGWQVANWLRLYPAARLLLHREIDTQGKTDPAGLRWPAILAAIAPWLTPSPLGAAPDPAPGDDLAGDL